MPRALPDNLRELLMRAPTVEQLRAREAAPDREGTVENALAVAAQIFMTHMRDTQGYMDHPQITMRNDRNRNAPSSVYREATMNCFYPGDLVSWPRSPWDRGAWRVEALVSITPGSRDTGGMPEECYRIIPQNTRRSMESHVVGRRELVRWTPNDHAFEPDDHVIYRPSPSRLSAEDMNMKTVFAERWVGTVRSSYMSESSPGDIIVQFMPRQPHPATNTLNAIRWRADFRLATPEEVTNMRQPLNFATSTQRIATGGTLSGDITSYVFNGETVYRASDGNTFTSYEGAARHNAAIARLRDVAPPPMSVEHAARVLGIDLASGPDRTAVTTVTIEAPLQPVSNDVLQEMVERAIRMTPEPKPVVIGGKRKLKL
jgi:hypothetical protein